MRGRENAGTSEAGKGRGGGGGTIYIRIQLQVLILQRIYIIPDSELVAAAGLSLCWLLLGPAWLLGEEVCAFVGMSAASIRGRLNVNTAAPSL